MLGTGQLGTSQLSESPSAYCYAQVTALIDSSIKVQWASVTTAIGFYPTAQLGTTQSRGANIVPGLGGIPAPSGAGLVNADIKQTYFPQAQSQADIKQTYPLVGISPDLHFGSSSWLMNSSSGPLTIGSGIFVAPPTATRLYLDQAWVGTLSANAYGTVKQVAIEFYDLSSGASSSKQLWSATTDTTSGNDGTFSSGAVGSGIFWTVTAGHAYMMRGWTYQSTNVPYYSASGGLTYQLDKLHFTTDADVTVPYYPTGLPFGQAQAYLGWARFGQAQARILHFGYTQYGLALALIYAPSGFLIYDTVNNVWTHKFEAGWPNLLPIGDSQQTRYTVSRFVADQTGTWQFWLKADYALWMTITGPITGVGATGWTTLQAGISYQAYTYYAEVVTYDWVSGGRVVTIDLIAGQEYNISFIWTLDYAPNTFGAQYKRPSDSSWHFLTDANSPWMNSPLGFAQALTQINPPYVLGQAQAQINVHGVQAFSQSLSDILTTYPKYLGWSTVFYDTFTDTNGTNLENHTPEIGSWSFSWGGHTTISNNIAVGPGGNGQTTPNYSFSGIAETWTRRFSYLVPADASITGPPILFHQLPNNNYEVSFAQDTRTLYVGWNNYSIHDGHYGTFNIGGAAGSTAVWVKVEIHGYVPTHIQAKCWSDGSGEPNDWQIDVSPSDRVPDYSQPLPIWIDSNSKLDNFKVEYFDLTSIGPTFAQARADILVTTSQAGQAQAYLGWARFAQTQAKIIIVSFNKAQAQALIQPIDGLVGGSWTGGQSNTSAATNWFKESGPNQPNYSGGAPYPGYTVNDNQGAVWLGNFVADVSGTWGFASSTDDGSKVEITAQLPGQLSNPTGNFSVSGTAATMNNNWTGGQGETYRQGTIDLIAGQAYTIRAYAGNGVGPWAFRFYYWRPGQIAVNFLTDNNAPWIYAGVRVRVAQAQVDILQTYTPFAQTQALLNTGFGLGQVTADIFATSLHLAQTQALIASSYAFLVSGNPYIYPFDNFATSWEEYDASWPNYPISNYYNFSAVSRFVADTTGTWNFRVSVDDSAFVRINDTFVINTGITGYGSFTSGSISLQAGTEYNISVGLTNSDHNTEYLIIQYLRPGDSTWYYLTDGHAPWIHKLRTPNHAQALARIVGIGTKWAQTQARLIGTDYTVFSQAMGSILSPNGYAQAQAHILTKVKVYGQSLAQIGHLQFAQAQARLIAFDIPVVGQAQTFVGHLQSANTRTWIKSVSAQFGQTQTFVGHFKEGQAQADIKQTYWTFGQSAGLVITYIVSQSLGGIKQTYPLMGIDINYALVSLGASATDSYGESGLNAIDGNDYGPPWMIHLSLGQTLDIDLGQNRNINFYRIVPAVYDATVNLQYYTDTWHDAVGIQFNVDYYGMLDVTRQVYGEIPPITARYWRLYVTDSGSYDGTAIATIELGWATAKSPTFAQAQAFLGHVVMGQATAYVSPGVGFNWGQAKTDITNTYQVYGQTKTWIIPPTVIANTTADILQIYIQHSYPRAWIIPPTVIANANAKIIAFDLPHFGQATGDILTEYLRIGQAKAHITKRAGHGLTLGTIKDRYHGRVVGQARAVNGHWQMGYANALIIKIWQIAQTRTSIKKTDIERVAQARAFIWQYIQWAHVQADITQTYSVYAITGALLNTGFGLGQTQADILAVYSPIGQAQLDVKQTYRPTAYVLADIRVRHYNPAQVRAVMTRQTNQSGQSMAWIGYHKFGLSQARIIAFNVPECANAGAYILGNPSIIPPGPSSSYYSYLVRFNDQDMPGYAQAESYDSTMNIATQYGSYINRSLSEYQGLTNKVITLKMRVWESTYAECKAKVSSAATIFRSSRKGFTRLYIQNRDKYYLALAKKISTSKTVNESMRILDYDAEFEAKPWLISNAVYVLAGTGSIDTGASRTARDGGWTPAFVTVSGTDISITGATEDGQNIGTITIAGTVSNMTIDTEEFTTTEPDKINKDFSLYLGPGKNYFTITGATSCTIQWQNRYYL